MRFHYSSSRYRLSRPIIGFLCAILGLALPAKAQIIQRQIGGVRIDANGAVSSIPQELRGASVEALRSQLAAVPADFNRDVPQRAISLAKLNAELARLTENAQPIPPEIKYLGGLMRAELIIADPQHHDLILVGPAEPWTVHSSGDVVGRTSGRPVVQLDDLLTAFRAVELSRTEGITCSIDPTEAGRRELQKFLNTVRQFQPQIVRGIEQALGPQVISVTGVPHDSHFANVLVACDYQMKRYGMSLEPSPIADMPGFLELIQARKHRPGNMMPRWWISCEHSMLSRSEDGLVWQLPRPTVSVLTEEEIIGSDGKVTGTGKTDPVAKQWADTMTSKYGELAKVDTMFAQLENLVDLAVVAALIEKEGLRQKAECPAEVIFAADSKVQPERWLAPRAVPSQGSFIRVGREFVITASGGVEIRAWETVERSQVSSELAKRQEHVTSGATGDAWQWSARD